MDQEKLMNVLKDTTFVEKLVKLQTPEEVQVAFKEKGIEISLEEIGLLGSTINKMVEKRTTELSKEDLESISGGAWKEDLKNVGLGTIAGPKLLFKPENRGDRMVGIGIVLSTAAIVAASHTVVPWAWKKGAKLLGYSK